MNTNFNITTDVPYGDNFSGLLKSKIIDKLESHFNYFEDLIKISKHHEISLKNIDFFDVLDRISIFGNFFQASETKDLYILFSKDKNILAAITIYYSGSRQVIFNPAGNKVDLENYCKLEIEIYSDKSSNIINFERDIKELFKENINDDVSCEITWFIDIKNEVHSRTLYEKIDDDFYKEAYPYLDIDRTINSYLNSEESVLLLIGPPGTGKTRLLRYIFKEMYKKQKDVVKVAYSCDQELIKRGQIFVDFILGNDQVLVLEDIDYELRPRSQDNKSMYNILVSSDGIAVNSSKKRKIILTTNLSSIDNIDNALLRPGRCYGVINMRNLTIDESKKFLEVTKTKNIDSFFKEDKKLYSLAELYRFIKCGNEECLGNSSTPKIIGF